jgi:hypothetical protein
MGPLRNPRHERFAQGLFEGLPALRAFEQAGYAPNDGNAIRLKGNERIQERLAELQAAAARNSEVTVASLLAELEDARMKATSLSQLSAAVRATEAKARISGLLTEKIEVKQTTEEKFENCQSMDDIIETMVDLFKDDVLEEDMEEFRRLTRMWWERFDDFQRAARARPVQQPPRMSAEERERIERRRLGLPQRRIGNGSQR